MKTLNLILITSLLFTFSVSKMNAQSENFKKIEYGFAYGIRVNDAINHEGGLNFRVKFSPVLLSSFIQFNKSEKLGFVAEMEYLHKGPEII